MSANTPRKLDRLLQQLCLQHGHCGGRAQVRDLLPTAGVISAEEFANLVLRAEQIEATYSPDHYAQQHQLISSLFREHMQAEQVEVANLS